MNLYSTRDFYLVAYLHLLGNKINNTRLVNRNTTEFSFMKDEELEKRVAKFYSQQASVDPMSYGSSFRTVKSLIHSLKTGFGSSTSTSEELNNEFNNKQRRYIS